MKASYYLYIMIVVVALVTIVISTGIKTTDQRMQQEIPAEFREVTLYKSPSCGCCDGHASAYREMGFTVTIVERQNMQPIKERYGIPYEKQSCHTAVMGEYFVEGHVPMEVIDDLVERQPAIDGILLPGMPSGTPGMPGPKMGSYNVLKKEGEHFSTYMEV